MSARILVVDDDPSIQSILKEMLEALGHQVAVVGSGEDALESLTNNKFDLLLLDLNLPQMDGLQTLKEVKKQDRALAIILVSGSMSIQDSVEAMRHGAFHCLTKPVIFKDLERSVNQAVCGTVLHKEIRCEGLPNCAMVVASPAMQRISDLVHKVSRSPASTVLIMGETGTGKEVVARYIHHLSDRRDRNFVAVNCAAIPESLIESELFGHDRGAFTDAKASKMGLFEEAHKGTLFLDEIGELPLPMQSKLLRALQERVIRRVGGSKDIQVDVRILAATNINLQDAVADGSFREDLFYRLQVIPLIVPPLRDRPEDILPLAEYFCREFSREFARAAITLSDEDKEILATYQWPGNVRELRNCVERSVLLDLGEVRPMPQLVPTRRSERTGRLGGFDQDNYTLTLEDPSLANAERTLILEVMNRVHGNKNRAAHLLGINRTTLYRKLTSYGVECMEEVGIGEPEEAFEN